MTLQKTITVGGKEYVIQKVPPREWTRMRDRSKDRNGNIVEERLIDEMFKHMVIDPKVSMDDFEDWAEVQDIFDAVAAFQLGRHYRAE